MAVSGCRHPARRSGPVQVRVASSGCLLSRHTLRGTSDPKRSFMFGGICMRIIGTCLKEEHFARQDEPWI